MTPRVERILVGVDGSDNSRRALEWAVVFARRFGAEVVAVHAAGLLAHLGEGPPVPTHSHLDELRRVFETKWCAPASDSGVAYRLLLSNGPPALVLLGAAEREEADLVVVGSPGGRAGFRSCSWAAPAIRSPSTPTAPCSSCRPILIVVPSQSRSSKSYRPGAPSTHVPPHRTARTCRL